MDGSVGIRESIVGRGLGQSLKGASVAGQALLVGHIGASPVAGFGHLGSRITRLVAGGFGLGGGAQAARAMHSATMQAKPVSLIAFFFMRLLPLHRVLGGHVPEGDGAADGRSRNMARVVARKEIARGVAHRVQAADDLVVGVRLLGSCHRS